ncbi:unnamed protein product, partial [Porites lobata]
SYACGSFIQNENKVFHQNWSPAERKKSSTWRELKTVELALISFAPSLHSMQITWFTDNANVASIVHSGSKVPELQDLALRIFHVCVSFGISLELKWIPRSVNSEAEHLSRIIDFDDYTLNDDVFHMLDFRWGPHTIDRFACSYNAKLSRFNSRFFQPGTEAVDAFLQNWHFENNWILPPVSQIARVIAHLRVCKAEGTLVIPLWKSSYFWPELSFIVVALRISFKLPERISLSGFCTHDSLWQEVFKDPDLQSLSARLQTTILSARAPATVSMYDRAFRRWKEFALSKHELSYLPANPMHVAFYLQYVLESTRSSSSVDTAFYSIKWAHELAGLLSPTDNPLVNRVREAAKRILGAKRCHRKEPLSIEIIKDIISAADLSNTLQLRNICLYVLCYAGFFRSEEVTSIRRNHITFHDGYMTIKVEKSKTDQLRQGDEVIIAQSGGSVCPVSILRDYLSRLNIDPHSDELIFRQLVKTKSFYKMVNKDKPISYTTFRDHLSKSLRSVVPDPSVYGTHSFRSGGATKAANSGVGERVFQRHGRWKSVSAKDGYVKDNITSRISVSKSLGL